MVKVAVLVLQLVAGADEEAREAVRLRADAHGVLGASFSGFAIGAGPGVSLEVGLVFADRFSFGLRGTLITLIVVNSWMVGLALEYAINDRFNLGVAPSIGVLGNFVYTDMPFSSALFAPVRLTFAAEAPFRSDQEVPRKGLTLFAEAGPGFMLRTSAGFRGAGPPPTPLSFTAAIGVGYSVW